MIPVFKPCYDEKEAGAVQEVLKTGWTGLGPKTKEFEDRFSKEICSGLHVVAVNSCTAALDLALKLIDLKPGDQVIVPTITFVSTAHVVKYNQGEVVFCDVDPETLLLDLEDVKKKINKRTRAIIPVHYAGRPVDMEALFEIVPDGVKIIEDCAHACGSRINGTALPLADMGCFSFHAVKNLSMGDGGALVLWDEEKAEQARRLRWLGIDKSTWDRSKVEQKYWWEYSVDHIGLKCHMNDISASIGLVQLDKLQWMNEKRRLLVKRYKENLSKLPDWAIHKLPPDIKERDTSSWHLFCVQVHHRDRLSMFLQEYEISTGVHYKPIHLYDCYGNKPYLPNAETVFKNILTFPLYPDLTFDQVDYICGRIEQFYTLIEKNREKFSDGK